MDYNTVRSIAKDGDVLFLTVDKKNILSRITSFFTKSPFTHACFCFWYKERLMIVESTTHGGIRIVLASTYADRNFEMIAAPRCWSEIDEKVLAKSGTTAYGWLSAMYIGVRDFCLTHFDIKLPVYANNKNKACSEFVAEILGLSDTDISPKALYNILEKQ